MKPTAARISKAKSQLRHFIEHSSDPIEIRIAYAAEEVLRWATEDTVDWGTPLKMVQANCEILSCELARAEAPTP